MTRRALWVVVCAVLAYAILLGGRIRAADTWPVTFVDVADRAGLRAASIYGGVDRKRFILEANGAGTAFVDYDNDGWVDALVLNGVRLRDGTRQTETYAPGSAPTPHLYRNNHDGTFTDVTARSGLQKPGWASSVCAGDYDNDGFIDLAFTYYGDYALFHNRGDGTFQDVTREAGLPAGGTRWASGCTFVDYDRDGRVDLFIAHYLKFDLQTAAEVGQGPNCLWKGVPVNCGPRGLPADTNVLFHNDGSGRFHDVSTSSGIARVTGRYAMTAVAADFDGDGWIDIYVACDSTASILYRNNHDGTFTDTAVESGVAYSENGTQQAGMGVALADYNGDGRFDLIKTHFADDVPALYRNVGKGMFEDVAVAAGLGVLNRYVEWGAGLSDFDNDGDEDVLVFNMNEPPSLLRNEYKGSNHWIAVKLEGTTSNRAALGAMVKVTASGHQQVQVVLSQSSYYSHDDLRLHFGLGSSARVDELQVTWPTGTVETMRDVIGDRVVTLKERATARQ